MAKSNISSWIRQRSGNIFALIVIGYLLLGSVKLIVENYRIHQDRISLKNEISSLEEQNTQLKNLTAYYRTDSFKEKEARTRLNYQKPGERVIVVPMPTGDDSSNLTRPGIETKPTPPPSNPEAWWRYFFGSHNA